MATFRAVVFSKQGKAADVLRIVEKSVPTNLGPREVLVRLSASGVNPSDTKQRTGTYGPMRFPEVTPHSDGAGVVHSIGSEVKTVRVGQRVWTFNAQFMRAHGTAAEMCCLPDDLVVPLPDKATFEQGACLGIPAMTAHRVIFVNAPARGHTVLINNGAGAVGRYAIQFAKHAGARVIATVGNEAKADVARAAGADDVVNYRNENLVERVRALTGGRGVDRLIDMDAHATAPQYADVMAEYGSITVYGTGAPTAQVPILGLFRLNVSLHGVYVYKLPDEARAAAIRDITRGIEDGTLTHHVAATFPLADVARAHEATETGVSSGGNIVVTM
jgi:NADPH2:quinone reductase